jgi:phosphoserine phosphatase SerB
VRLSDLYSLTQTRVANNRSAFQVRRPPPCRGAGSTTLTLTYSTLLTLSYTLAWSCYADTYRHMLTLTDTDTYRHIQLHVSGLPAQCERMREDLYRISMQEPVDLAVQEDDLFRRNRRLILFDMDSTLIQCEVIDELAKVYGVGEQVAAITESAMRGEMGFSESFRQRIALLKGMPESVLEGIANNLPITEGAPRLISNLKKLGYKVGILSGGFTYFARRLQKELGIDYVHANELDFEDGRLTGKVKGEIVDGERKVCVCVDGERKQCVCVFVSPVFVHVQRKIAEGRVCQGRRGGGL